MFFYIFTAIFALSLARSLAFWLAYIQRKQYRLDRLWQALGTDGFWRLLVSKPRLLAFTLFIAWQIGVRWLASGAMFDALSYGALALFTAQAGIGLWHAWRKRLEMPRWTAKILAVGVLTASISALLTRLPWRETPFAWQWHIVSPEHALAIELILPFLTFSVFALLWLPNAAIQRYQWLLAERKRRAMISLRVIGITGSYGKTGTKEALAHILSQQYSVLKTPAHINVDTGIAKHLLANLDESHQWYVVEMGAYKTGEIARICRMVKPEYAVLTALSNQHVELFGSRQALRKAKFELIQSVAKPENIFVNADSPDAVSACRQQALTPIWYSVREATEWRPEDLKYSSEGSSFSIKGQLFRLPIFGSAHVNNAVAAIAVAHQAARMSLSDIALAIESLPTIPHTMEVKTHPQGALIVDATYNANSDGVIQAIDDLAITNRERKLIVFKDVIELGGESESEHIRIAQAMAEAKATVCLLPSPVRQHIVDRLRALSVDDKSIIATEAVPDWIRSAGAHGVAIFLGRDTQPLLDASL